MLKNCNKLESFLTQIVVLCVVAMMLTIWFATRSYSQTTDDLLNQPFPFEATEIDMTEIANTLSRRTTRPVRLKEGLSGRVSLRNPNGSVRDFLNELGLAADVVWWTDGVAIYLEPRAEVKSVLVYPKGLPLAEIEASLDALELDDARFPMRPTADAEVLRISGPGTYVDTVASLIETLIVARQRRTTGPIADDPSLPRIFRGTMPAPQPAPARNNASLIENPA